MLPVVNKLALGTVQFGTDYGISNTLGQTSGKEVIRILHLARECGLEILDTAYQYGSSEEVLGQTGPLIAAFKVVSKFPEPAPGLKIDDYLSKSLRRLNLSTVYGYLAHSAGSLLKDKSRWTELVRLKDAGRVSKIGYSLYDPMQLKDLLSRGMIPDIIQVPYNVLDRRFEPWFDELKTHKVEIHTRSAFLQGLLLINPEKLVPFFHPVRKILAEIRERFTSFTELSGSLLHFCAGHQMIDHVVVGVNDSNQLKENIMSLERSVHMPWRTYQDIPEEIILPFNWPKNGKF